WLTTARRVRRWARLTSIDLKVLLIVRITPIHFPYRWRAGDSLSGRSAWATSRCAGQRRRMPRRSARSTTRGSRIAWPPWRRSCRTPTDRGRWRAARGARHPIIVAEDADAGVVGWASLNAFNPRPAYDHVADLSVYIERGWRGKGVGRRLLERLVALGRELG